MELSRFRSITRKGLFSWMGQSKRNELEGIGKFIAKGRSKAHQKFFFLLGMMVFLLLWGELALGPGPERIMLAWAAEKKSESSGAASKVGPMLKLTPLVINLNEENGRHYVKATIVLEIGRKEWIDEIQKRIPSLTDMVILTLCDKKLQDLKQPQSKEELRKELLAKARQALNSSKIKQIYFDEFLYQ